ncbi:MAG: biotin-dependent carboxyltransferase family protein [Proteobacteria bacterium]|nr:biotin-dependent carboxyltransferase family protein [Pseudomonadota bacterium]MDA1330992.1 biotin-dependent carboxyltransferase family protein [Pseudomonadota bacterium]
MSAKHATFIHVLSPGVMTTIQDRGRTGWQDHGVSVSGAADLNSMVVANALVGNKLDAPIIEFVMVGPTLAFSCDCVIAFAGADFAFNIDGNVIPLGRPIWIYAGARVTGGRSSNGAVGYLAISGILDIHAVMGSVATDTGSKFGGVEGRPLKKGDVLAIKDRPDNFSQLKRMRAKGGQPFITPTWSVQALFSPRGSEERGLRFLPSERWMSLSEEVRQTTFSSTYRVTPQSNRMGVRLSGKSIDMRKSEYEPSVPVVFGVIQVPPSGQPIILSVDRQTIGGYPSIGVVASVDRATVVQSQPGDGIRFTEISVKDAQSALIKEQNAMAELIGSIGQRIQELN